MDDREFLDFLYQGWSQTTGAKDMFWMPEEELHRNPPKFDIVAVAEDQSQKHIASELTNEDAAFIVAAHGSVPDLIRRLHSALDEADRLDREADEREKRIFDLEVEVDAKNQRIAELQREFWEENR